MQNQQIQYEPQETNSEWSYSKVPYTLEKSVVAVNAIVAVKTI